MVKTLQKHGNSQALVIDKALMDAMGIQQDTPLQITLSGRTLVITPANVGVGREKIRQIFDELMPEYDQMLKNLAE